MEFKELVKRNRSYRRFYQDHEISYQKLRDLVDLARLTPSAANRQPLRYIFSHYPEKNAMVFQYLAWAAYLPNWDGPQEGERPSAYIVILNDMTMSKSVDCDHGIAAQTILLGAAAMGLGGCMIASIKKEGLRIALNIPTQYEILMVIALGKPREAVVIDGVGPEGDIKYFRDEGGVHHVPKRALDDLILDL
ncbi:MAG: nitroreductase family protein [Spirochaetes bacterium]|nr:nitroreductase family protein [Spirochaetota bacterium]